MSVERVSKSYGRATVLREVSLDIAPGQITAIIGPNASGKTTLNKMLLGLVHPDEGIIRFDGVDVRQTAGYRERIGYMPQAARFPDNLCAQEIIDMLRDVRGGASVCDDELVRVFNLHAVLRAPLRYLSGGTRQRVSAAIAFLFAPDVLVLDEPTAALDPLSSSLLKDKIARERSAGRTVVITSHVLSELEDFADQIVFLLDGGVRFLGTPAALADMMHERSLERAAAALMREGPRGTGVAA